MKSFEKNRNYKDNFLLKLFFLIVGLIFSYIQILHAQNVKLGWDLSTNPDILSYNIYRTAHVDSSFSLLNTVTHPDSTYLDANMEWDTHYYYVATSIDRFGTESGFSNMVDTTLQSNVPVELFSFSARVSNTENIILEWSTTTECNNYGFEVQRLSNESPRQFKSIGFVKGNGTAARPKNYQFVDKNLPEGTFNYRLKQIDFDGSYEFSDTIEITIELPSSVQLYKNYPNPFNSSTTISYTLPKSGHVELKIYNIKGEEIFTLVEDFQNTGHQSVVWHGFDKNGFEVSTGIYYVRLKTSDQSQFRRMLLMK